MKEAGSHWQSNPLAVYILCCAPPRDVQAHTNNGEDFPLSAPQKSISLSKLTPSKQQLATPSNKPVQSAEIEIRWSYSRNQIISQVVGASQLYAAYMPFQRIQDHIKFLFLQAVVPRIMTRYTTTTLIYHQFPHPRAVSASRNLLKT
jgi:hypothetical protein